MSEAKSKGEEACAAWAVLATLPLSYAWGGVACASWLAAFVLTLEWLLQGSEIFRLIGVGP